MFFIIIQNEFTFEYPSPPPTPWPSTPYLLLKDIWITCRHDATSFNLKIAIKIIFLNLLWFVSNTILLSFWIYFEVKKNNDPTKVYEMLSMFLGVAFCVKNYVFLHLGRSFVCRSLRLFVQDMTFCRQNSGMVNNYTISEATL